MSPEAWIALGTLVAIILCAVFNYVLSRIKEQSAQLIAVQKDLSDELTKLQKELSAQLDGQQAKIEALSKYVSLECVTYERLEKLMAQSYLTIESTMRRFEEDLKSLNTVKETVIAIKTKMELKP